MTTLEKEAEKAFLAAANSLAEQIATLVEHDVGVPASESKSAIVEALHADCVLPTDEEWETLVYGDDDGVVPTALAMAYPNLHEVLDKLVT